MQQLQDEGRKMTVIYEQNVRVIIRTEKKLKSCSRNNIYWQSYTNLWGPLIMNYCVVTLFINQDGFR